jgi:1-acyl-sn-glycerol-3-phosphate acyltransferase
MLKYGKFPYGLGNHISFEVHRPWENTGEVEELIGNIEKTITKALIKSA